MKRIITLLIFLQAFACFNSYAALSVRLFNLKSSSNQYDKICNATLIKTKNQCVLLTNYHCVEDTHESYLLPSIYDEEKTEDYYIHGNNYFTKEWDKYLKVNIVKVDPNKDLAQIELPKEIEEQYCPQLENSKINNYQSSMNQFHATGLASLGHIKGLPFVYYSGNLSWDRGSYRNASVKKRIFVNNGDFFYYISDLNMFAGMSGGAVIDYRGHFMGILSQYVLFQEKCFISPLSMIHKFLEKKDNNAVLSIAQSPVHTSASFGFQLSKRIMLPSRFLNEGMKSEPVFIDPLGKKMKKDDYYRERKKRPQINKRAIKNDHAEGGEIEENNNNGKYAEDIRFGKNNIDRLIDILIGDEEGVIDPSNSNKILLGFSSKTKGFGAKTVYHQFDGNNDYLFKFEQSDYLNYQFAKHKFDKMITRPLDGHIQSKDIRKNILKRLAGDYGRSSIGTHYNEGAYPLNQKHLLLIPDANNLEGYRVELSGTPLMQILIDAKKKRIKLYSYSYTMDIANKLSIFAPIRIPDFSLEYDVSFDEEYNNIYLEAKNGARFRCENNGLIKIICRSRDNVISLSLDNTGKERIIRYRIISKLFHQGKMLIDYKFGNVKVMSED